MITSKAIRIRTRIVKDSYVEDGVVGWERVTKSIVITTMDNEVDIVQLHDKIVQAIKS